MNTCFRFLLCISLSWASAVQAGNYYEQEIAAKLTEDKLPEEVRRLEAQGTSFIGLYDEPSVNQPEGAVILLHQMGGHPDWPQVIGPLRSGLSERGWATLSIQMPILSPGEPIADYGKTLDQARARIDAALQYLLERRYLNIVLTGYSFGAALGADYLAVRQNRRIKAFVGVSMQTHPFLNPRLELLQQLDKIEIPVLDIYGSRDFDAVLRQAEARRMAGRRAGNRHYHQRIVDGADHYFTRLEDMLIRQIRGWLDKAAPGVQIRADEEFERSRQTQEQTDEAAAQE